MKLPSYILLNSDIPLFLFKPGWYMRHLSTVRIHQIHWSTGVAEAHMRLIGHSKDAKVLLNIEASNSLHFRNVECGDRSDPDNGDEIATFLVDKVKRRWTPDLVITNLAKMKELEFCISLKGELALYL